MNWTGVAPLGLSRHPAERSVSHRCRANRPASRGQWSHGIPCRLGRRRRHDCTLAKRRRCTNDQLPTRFHVATATLRDRQTLSRLLPKKVTAQLLQREPPLSNLSAKLEEIRSSGFSTSVDEILPGVRAFAAPIFGAEGDLFASVTVLETGSAGRSDSKSSGTCLSPRLKHPPTSGITAKTCHGVDKRVRIAFTIGERIYFT